MITQKEFQEIASEPNWPVTWIIRIVFFSLFAWIVLLIYSLPVLFYIDSTIDQDQLFAFGVIFYPILIGLTYVAVRYLRRLRAKAVRHIRVNREGVFYELVGGTEEALRFAQLEGSSNDLAIYDIFIDSKLTYTGEATYKRVLLKVFLDGKDHEVRPFHPDWGYSYFCRNSHLLRSHFMYGISLFRPDLRIDPFVYSEFSIHPETFAFDKKRYWSAVIISVIIIILLFIGVEWYMKYRFGEYLFFCVR